jgi:hypothetical protein
MIDKQQLLDNIAGTVLDKMDQEIRAAIDQKVAAIVDQHLATLNITSRVDNNIGNYLKYLIEDNNRQLLLNRFVEKTDVAIGMMMAELPAKINNQVADLVKDIVHSVDIADTVKNTTAQLLSQVGMGWPDRSIPSTALNLDHAVISASVLQGGQANNFASTGLSDFASNSVLTLTDDQILVDTNLIVKGNLVVLGKLETDTVFYQTLSKDVADSVATNIASVVDAARAELNTGISVEQVLLNGDPIIKENALSRFVTDSNLQKVGQLRELDVAGEALINETVYVGRRRMGINTLEPQSALDIWDQEVEIIAEKFEANTGYLGLGKTGTLRIGVDRRNAITIRPNADVEIPGLKIGRLDKIALSVSADIPTGPGSPGDIIFNNQPIENSIFAWICLEGTRWAPVRLDM